MLLKLGYIRYIAFEIKKECAKLDTECSICKFRKGDYCCRTGFGYYTYPKDMELSELANLVRQKLEVYFPFFCDKFYTVEEFKECAFGQDIKEISTDTAMSLICELQGTIECMNENFKKIDESINMLIRASRDVKNLAYDGVIVYEHKKFLDQLDGGDGIY